MTKTRSTKRALLTSALALLMCVSMLIGSTFAWFTDSVTSGNNIIKSGNLDVEMYWADGTKAVPTADADCTDASAGAIFDYDKWEPGYTEVRHIKIANVGTLALKYQLSIAANGEVTDLADVIDVYYLDPAQQLGDRAAIDADMRLGTLTEVLDAISTTASGNLEAGEAHTVTLALKMQESAGNEYQNKSIGTDFSVLLAATQKDFESDSFGTDYDKGLDPEASYVSTPAQLQDALKKGGKIILQDDITLDATAEFMATNGNGSLLYLDHVDVTLDLNGYDIIAEADAEMIAGKAPNALILVRYSTLNIIGDGSLITKNKSMPVYGWANSTINIYGGTFKGNAYERNESDVYVNNANVTINVYGGDFSESGYAFNAHDTSANAPVIILHEGVTYKDFMKNGTTNVIASDINKGRIVLADGMYLKTYEENGETVHQVAKIQAEASYPSDYEALTSASGSSGGHVLLDDIVASDKIYFGDNTTNTIDLNGKTVTAEGGFLFATQGENCVLTIEGDGTVEVDSGYAGFASKGGTLNINGGTYELGETNNKGHLYSQNSSTIVINDGTYISTDANTPIVYCINGFVEINGGFFQNTANPSAALLSMGNNLSYINNQKITLRGGTFVNWNPMDSAFARPWTNPDVPALIVLADGYKMVSETQANGDVWYTVVAE